MPGLDEHRETRMKGLAAVQRRHGQQVQDGPPDIDPSQVPCQLLQTRVSRDQVGVDGEPDWNPNQGHRCWARQADQELLARSRSTVTDKAANPMQDDRAVWHPKASSHSSVPHLVPQDGRADQLDRDERRLLDELVALPAHLGQHAQRGGLARVRERLGRDGERVDEALRVRARNLCEEAVDRAPTGMFREGSRKAPEALLARRAVDGTHRTNGLGAWMRAMICGVTSSHKSAEMSSQPACTAASTSARWPCVNQSVSNRSRSCSAEPSRVSAVDRG